MENKKLLELRDDDLNAVSGGTDPNYYRSCTDFHCFYCGYQKTDSGEMSHLCLGRDFNTKNRCDNCEHLQSCSHGQAFMDEYNAARWTGR